MIALSEEEKRQINETLSSLVQNRDVQASCVYGSQIAGYATDRSDFDVMLVLNQFRQRIKYYYLKGATRCSVLAIDSKSFEGDCKKSSLGEFVAGRMLNPFECLHGEGYLRKQEVGFKTNVILEGLADSISENQNFTDFIIFKLSYFLFDKLRKRAAVYPPVVYSYSMTYSKDLIKANAADTLAGFRIAAKILEDGGLIRFDEKTDEVELVPGKFEYGLGSKLSTRAAYTAKSLTQYAVHGYAGRVGVDVIGRELLSKLSRSRKKYVLPAEIKEPRRFWRIREGILFPDTADWRSDLLESLGISSQTASIRLKNMGEFYNSTTALEVEEGKKKLKLAVKRYTDIKSMKWIIVNLWSLKNTSFTLAPLERLARECRGHSEFKKLNIRTPLIVAIFLSERILVTEFIEGYNLSEIESRYLENGSEDLTPIRRFGETLAVIHNSGYCMGDSKPSNAIVSAPFGDIYIVDLEQFHKNGNIAWDIAEFVYYSTMFTLKEERSRKIIDAFVGGYQAKSDNPENIRKASALRYRAPFQPFIAPNLMNSIRKDLLAS